MNPQSTPLSGDPPSPRLLPTQRMSKGVAILLMIFSVACLSSSVIFIKLSNMEAGVLSSGRLLVSALILTPLFLRHWGRTRETLTKGWYWMPLGAALMLGAHLVSWTIGARMTSSGNGTLVVNSVPLVMPFLGYWIAREKATWREILGSLVAFAGVVLLVMTSESSDAGEATWQGDVVCFVSMLFLGVYVALSRRLVPRFSSPWVYSIPMYYYAGIFAALFVGDFSDWKTAFQGSEPLWLLGLAVVPTILGHGLMMKSLQVLKGQTTAVMNLGQFLFSGIMAWLVFQEIPGIMFYPAAAITVLGCMMVIFGKNENETSAQSR